MISRILTWSICCVLAATAACSDPPASPETEIREFIARAETAAEERDLGAFKPLVAEDYIDSHQHDKRSALNIMRLYFFRQQSIHLLVRIQEIAIATPSQATVLLAVAVAGAPLPDDLGSARARLLSFDLSLSKIDGDWVVRQADWEDASLADFL